MPKVRPGFFRRNSDNLYSVYLNGNRSSVDRSAAAASWVINGPFTVVEETIRAFLNIPFSTDLSAQFAARSAARLQQLAALKNKALSLGPNAHHERAQIIVAVAGIADGMVSDINRAAALFTTDVALPLASVVGPLGRAFRALRGQIQAVAKAGIANTPKPPQSTPVAPAISADATSAALARGASRRQLFGQNWKQGSLRDTIRQIAGSNPEVTSSGSKLIYRRSGSTKQVVYDRGGDYFRIEDTSIATRRRYLDLNGNAVPNNKTVTVDGSTRQVGMSTAEYNAKSHFRNSDT